jgi:hypothetical protein
LNLLEAGRQDWQRAQRKELMNALKTVSGTSVCSLRGVRNSADRMIHSSNKRLLLLNGSRSETRMMKLSGDYRQ